MVRLSMAAAAESDLDLDLPAAGRFPLLVFVLMGLARQVFDLDPGSGHFDLALAAGSARCPQAKSEFRWVRKVPFLFVFVFVFDLQVAGCQRVAW